MKSRRTSTCSDQSSDAINATPEEVRNNNGSADKDGDFKQQTPVRNTDIPWLRTLMESEQVLQSVRGFMITVLV